MGSSAFHTFAHSVASGQNKLIDPNAFARGWQMRMKASQNEKQNALQQQGLDLRGQELDVRKNQFNTMLPLRQQQADAGTLNAQVGATRASPEFRAEEYKRRLNVKGTPSGDPRIAGAVQSNPDIFAQNPEGLANMRNQGEYERRNSAELGAQDARLYGEQEAQVRGLRETPEQKAAGKLLGQQDKIGMVSEEELFKKYDNLIRLQMQKNPQRAQQFLKQLRDVSGGGGQPAPQGGGQAPRDISQIKLGDIDNMSEEELDALLQQTGG